MRRPADARPAHALRAPSVVGPRLGVLPLILAALVLGACASPGGDDALAGPAGRSAAAAPGASDDALSAAFAELVDTLADVEQEIRRSPSFGTEAERVGGYRHLLRGLAKGLEAEIQQDPDYPWFRILDFWLREGGDNPDQRYAFSPIRGGETYRIFGRLGSAARVELQLYAGKPWAGTGGSAGYLAFEDLALAEDGSFEVWLAPTPPPEDFRGSWLANPADATTVFVRHIYDDWNDAPTGDVHIDRVGFEGRRRPPESEDELAARLRAAAATFRTTALTWPAFVNRRYAEARAPNTVAPPYDTYSLGGAKGRWMSGGYFELEPGEAVLLRVPPTRAQVQGIQLTDMWFASLEHANLISSLTTRQSLLSPDGAYYYVIAAEDPGHANWLDTGGLQRGTFLLRWDGMGEALGQDELPSAERVLISELRELIPGFERVPESERERTRAARRRHLQDRSHR